MEYFSFFAISVPGAVYSICWLIDRKDQRKFCKNATSVQTKLYIDILASSKRYNLPLIMRLKEDEKLVEQEVLKTA